MRLHALGAFVFLCATALFSSETFSQDVACMDGTIRERLKCLAKEMAALKRVPGPQGERGDKGDKGDAGEKGDKGDAGAKGDKGDLGDKGDKGEKGDPGDKGEKGDPGTAASPMNSEKK